MSNWTYTELVRELFPRLSGGVRWGLGRTERLLESVGNPHRAYRTIHVGGTNGKGSVAASVASILQEAGARTGLYTSPHVCTFRERMQVDGRALAEDAILDAARRLWPLIDSTGASFFEATTAIAFLAMAEAGVEWVVVEVGLGGRLDATNVVRPDVVALTNVALDHTEMLGGTVAEIAAEKAGIIKAGVPVVTSETDPVALGVFRERAAQVGAPLLAGTVERVSAVEWGRSGTRFVLATEPWGDVELWTPLIGPHQAWNAALAVEALAALPADVRPGLEEVRRGLSRVRWPGRVQLEIVEGVTWLFDAAHNPAGVETLIHVLPRLELPLPLVLLAGVLRDKDWSAMLAPLGRLVDEVVLTVPPSAPEHRRWDPDVAAARLNGSAPVTVEADFKAALARARRAALRTTRNVAGGEGAGTVIVTGSLHTVGDALLLLGRPPADALIPDLPPAVTPPADGTAVSLHRGPIRV